MVLKVFFLMRYIYIKTSHDKALKQEVMYEKPQVKMKRYSNWILKVLVVHLKYIFGHFNQIYLSLLHVVLYYKF